MGSDFKWTAAAVSLAQDLVRKGFSCEAVARKMSAKFKCSTSERTVRRVLSKADKARIVAPTGTNQRVLAISDLHAPYNHPDALDFLFALHKKYQFDRVVCIGDELDFQGLSYHETDPDLASAGDELEQGRKEVLKLKGLSGAIDFVESNHGSMVWRKAKTAGMPSSVIKSYRDVIGAPKGWNWHPHLVVNCAGTDVLFVHGKSSVPEKLSKAQSMCVVEGHFHTKFEISYWANTQALRWGMHVGCLVNPKSLAFAYNRVDVSRPILGCAAIMGGLPVLFPMPLNSDGRWTRVVP